MVELESLAERELRLRAARFPVVVAQEEPVALAPAVVEIDEDEPEPLPVERLADPALVTISKVQTAIAQAREAELAQRLPNGARRALQKLVRAQYVVRGADAPSVRGSLVEAMRDAETAAASMRKVAGDDVEVTVIDWDGEWPVVVRRYGAGGRTVYRVEDALKRAGIEEKAA